MRQRMERSSLGQSLFLSALFVAMTGELSLSDVMAGAAVAMLTVRLMRKASFGMPHFAPKLSWLPQLSRLPWQTVRDGMIVLVALFRAMALCAMPHGRLCTIPFHGRGSDGTTTARRVLVMWALSLAPNGYVVGMDLRRGSLLVHQLVASRRRRRRDPQWPL